MTTSATLVVGVPRETKEGEHRVAITPDGVHELRTHASTCSSNGPRARGRRSATTTTRRPGRAGRACRRRVGGAELVVKVKEPQPDELAHLRPGLVLFTYLHLAAYPAVADALLASQVTGIAYETVRRPAAPSVARADERGRRPHGATDRRALPRARPWRARRAARRRARGPPGAVVVIGAGNVG